VSTTHITGAATDVDEEAAQGRVYDVAGEDWDKVLAGDEQRSSGEQIVVNMGPQHPSTHGVIRLILTLDGETCPRLANSLPAPAVRLRA